MRPNNGVVEVPETPFPALFREIAAAADVPAYIRDHWHDILRIINEAPRQARRSAAIAIVEDYMGPDNPENPNRLSWQEIYFALLATKPPNHSAWAW